MPKGVVCCFQVWLTWGTKYHIFFSIKKYKKLVRHQIHLRQPFSHWSVSTTLTCITIFPSSSFISDLGGGVKRWQACFFYSLSLIQCQPSEAIPHWRGAVSGAPSSEWQALEVENCFRPTFSQPACSLTQTDRSPRANDSSLLLEMMEAHHRDLYQSRDVCMHICLQMARHWMRGEDTGRWWLEVCL